MQSSFCTTVSYVARCLCTIVPYVHRCCLCTIVFRVYRIVYHCYLCRTVLHENGVCVPLVSVYHSPALHMFAVQYWSPVTFTSVLPKMRDTLKITRWKGVIKTGQELLTLFVFGGMLLTQASGNKSIVRNSRESVLQFGPALQFDPFSCYRRLFQLRLLHLAVWFPLCQIRGFWNFVQTNCCAPLCDKWHIRTWKK